jgi:hypothetical protein
VRKAHHLPLTCVLASFGPRAPTAVSTHPVALPAGSRGGVLRQWEVDAPWARLKVVAGAFGPSSSLLLLTAARVLYWVHLDGSSGGHGGGGGVAPVQGSAVGGGGECCDFDKFSLKVGRRAW